MWSTGICICTYVGQKVPFFADAEIEMQINSQKDQLVLPDDFSPELQTLLHKLLAKDPSERPTVQEALQYPWLKDNPFLKKIEKNDAESEKKEVTEESQEEKKEEIIEEQEEKKEEIIKNEEQKE